MAATDVILPDLQSCVLCEDVRHEFNGMQTLVGVINIVPAPQLPITCMRLCIWSRWCSGAGRFKQRSRIVGVDEQQVLAQAEVDFELKEMEQEITIRQKCRYNRLDAPLSRYAEIEGATPAKGPGLRLSEPIIRLPDNNPSPSYRARSAMRRVTTAPK